MRTTRQDARERWHQMVGLVRTGCTAEELVREFECSAQGIRNWVPKADLGEGSRSDGLTTLECVELPRLRAGGAGDLQMGGGLVGHTMVDWVVGIVIAALTLLATTWLTGFLNRRVPSPARAWLALGNLCRLQPRHSEGRFCVVLGWLEGDSNGHDTNTVENAFRNVPRHHTSPFGEDCERFRCGRHVAPGYEDERARGDGSLEGGTRNHRFRKEKWRSTEPLVHSARG